MIVVIPVCNKDSAIALKNLAWLKRLGQKPNFHAIISCEREFDAEAIVESASQVFRSVDLFRYDKWGGEQAWPQPQNHAWQTMARHISKFGQPWLWWEADAIPLTADWLDQIQAAYIAGGKPFAGHVLTNEGHTYMAGVGVYPPKVNQYSTAAYICRAASFDVVLGQETSLQTADIGDLIQHMLFPVAFTGKSHLDSTIKAGAVLFHKCKDGSLIDVIINPNKKPKTTNKNVFVHGGDLGDIVYSLPTIKALGGGDLFFNVRQGTREPMTEKRSAFITPLLECQSYISKTGMLDAQAPTHDLNAFRDYKTKHQQWGTSLAEYHCGAFRVIAEDALQENWLKCNKRKIEKVVIHRSPRYHNDAFDWKRVLATYEKQIVFIGLKSEHSDFEKKFGPVPFLTVKNALDMAEVINGSELFIGNQSFPNSIAEGLKKRKITETWLKEPDCCFERFGASNIITKNMVLPDVCSNSKTLPS